MKEITLTKENFKSEVLESSIPVLVDFWASWCGPCKMLSPIVDQIADEFYGKVKVGKINVDEQMSLAIEYKIEVIPTLIFFKDGKIQKQFVYEKTEQLTYSRFLDYLIDICHELDIPTPVLTKTHIFNFAKFNHVKFPTRDFVESLDYDHLFLENIL